MIAAHAGSSRLHVSIHTRKVLVLAGLLFCARVAQGVSFAGGTGSADDPYQIATAEQLVAIGQDETLENRHYILTADIDLAGQVFSHTVIPEFGGVFDGNDHKILNLTLSVEEATSFDAALFGCVTSTAWIKNLGVGDVNITSPAAAAALVHTNYGCLTNCYSTGVVEWTALDPSQIGWSNIPADNDHAGGLVVSNCGRMTNCRSTVEVRAPDSDNYLGTDTLCAGGLIALNHGGSVVDCHSDGSVDVSSWYYGDEAGGLVGHNDAGGVIRNCSSTAAVEAMTSGGGLVGRNSAGCVVANCHSMAEVDADSSGGLVGCNLGAVVSCYSEGDVSGAHSGGFVGDNQGAVSNCYSTGDVSGGATGGFAGSNSGGGSQLLCDGVCLRRTDQAHRGNFLYERTRIH